MLNRFVSGRFIYFKLFVIFTISTCEMKVQSVTSSDKVLDSYIDKYDRYVEWMENCSQANLGVIEPRADCGNRNILKVTFKLNDPKFKCCFSYFNISLKKKKNRREVASARIPFNCSTDKAAKYNFKNITDGLYELRIQPCYNNWQCSHIIIKFNGTINMSSIACNGILPFGPIPYGEDFQKKIISIMTVAAMLLMVSSGVFAYCHYNSNVIRKKKEGKESEKFLEKTVQVKKREENFKRIVVYILHYSNEVIMRNVEILKDFLLKLPNIHVILIKDELYKILLNRTWWISHVLERSDGNGTLKKVIIVDANRNKNGKSSDDIENENENETFNEAVAKLNQNWLSSLNDYDRIFVIRFNGLTPSRSKALEFVVPGVRYDIPDNQLVTLCKVLLSGSGFDSYYTIEDFKELVKHHPIKNLSSIETEYYNV